MSGIAALSCLHDDMTIQERVAVVAPIVNDMLSTYTGGVNKEGIQTFQNKLVKLIIDSGCADYRWVRCSKAGCHPDNRDRTGLVPIDVHDLLRIIVLVGWLWSECQGALACEIPPNEAGKAWREFNAKLIAGSDGLLAKLNCHELEIVTARGSHTTALVNCMEFGTRGIHEEVCREGVISKAKIVELQPSMQEPCDKGLHYLVIRWQLVEVCPALMEMLARSGNAGHQCHRPQTALQMC